MELRERAQLRRRMLETLSGKEFGITCYAVDFLEVEYDEESGNLYLDCVFYKDDMDAIEKHNYGVTVLDGSPYDEDHEQRLLVLHPSTWN